MIPDWTSTSYVCFDVFVEADNRDSFRFPLHMAFQINSQLDSYYSNVYVIIF